MNEFMMRCEPELCDAELCEAELCEPKLLHVKQSYMYMYVSQSYRATWCVNTETTKPTHSMSTSVLSVLATYYSVLSTMDCAP